MDTESQKTLVTPRGIIITIPTSTLEAEEEPRPPCTAVIADLVKSRKYDHPDSRSRVQDELLALIQEFNDSYSSAIISKLLITTGDEIQGVLKNPDIIPDLIWLLEEQFKATDVRFGIGFGHLHTRIRTSAVGMDGPAFHTARRALEEAKSRPRLGGVFQGFGQSFDQALTGTAQLLRWCRDQFTDRQREIVGMLREGLEQKEVATRLEITPQAVSQSLRGAGWQAFRDAEAGWRAMLATFDTTSAWQQNE